MLHALQQEWHVIENAPWSFVTAVAALGVAEWFFLSIIYQSKLDGLTQQLSLKTDQLDHSERLLRDLRPTETSYARLSNEILARKADALAKRLREYYVDESDNQIREEEADRALKSRGEWSDGMFQAAKERRTIRWTSAYDGQFKSDAVLLRNEILLRLPVSPKGGTWGPGGEYRVDLSMYGSIQSLLQIEQLATHLESIGRLLPH